MQYHRLRDVWFACRYRSRRCVFASTSVRRWRSHACSFRKSTSSCFSRTRMCGRVRRRSKASPPEDGPSSATQAPASTRSTSPAPVSRASRRRQSYSRDSVITPAKEVMFLSAFVCLLAGLRKKVLNRFSQNSM